MTKAVPSQVIAFIDHVYPDVDKAPDLRVYASDAAILAAIIDLAKSIPLELLTINGDDYTGYVFGLESMKAAIDRWNYRGGDESPRTHVTKPKGPPEDWNLGQYIEAAEERKNSFSLR
jgi:hypothetical protein